MIEIEFHTDNQQIVEICRNYWGLDESGEKFIHKVSELNLPKGIKSSSISSFVAEYCCAYDPEIVCSDCDRPFCFTSRSDYQQRNGWHFNKRCEDCKLKILENERLQIQLAKERKREEIQIHYGSIEPVSFNPFDKLTFKGAVSLLALIRLCASEDLSTISPVEEAQSPFTPTDDLAFELLRDLYKDHSLSINPNASLDAFDDDVKIFYPLKVSWIFPLNAKGNFRDFLEELEYIFQTQTWPDEWYNEAFSFWQELALKECLQYFYVVMHEHRFEFSAGDKTRQVFAGLLQNFSVAEIYVFIYRAVKDSAAYMRSSGVPARQAANSTIVRLQRQGERAITEEWKRIFYNRDRRAPESMVSHVLYRTALKLGENGINVIPKKSFHNIEETIGTN